MAADSSRKRPVLQRARSFSAPPAPQTQLSHMMNVARQISTQMHDDPQFHIKGSMAAAVHGGHVTPGDIDMVVGSFPKANRTLGALGYPKVTPFKPRITAPPPGLPAIDVLHSGDWGADKAPKVTKRGITVTSVAKTLSDLRKDPRAEKRERNTRLIAEIVRANTHESPF